ncbi:hypothetical protein B0I35DRAFT_425734 [Stachybotrys elegans]|uniref:Uncharacterized protein n=1 Tax=Stachybotrys elegans TaxID=80388 RepID=A0A8K0SSZ6_9HYPO|nr:hypothetical protein B0I35DRAFT_425734 [Stachybotrys elegans]
MMIPLPSASAMTRPSTTFPARHSPAGSGAAQLSGMEKRLSPSSSLAPHVSRCFRPTPPPATKEGSRQSRSTTLPG